MLGITPLITFSNVDFPEPVLPTSSTNSPSSISRDIFLRYFYDDIKRQVNDAKVYLSKCEYDKEYGQCMIIKTSHIITNLKEIGFVNTTVIANDGYMLYYVPLKDMLDVFDNMWKEANHNKPIRFEFMTRRVTDKETGKVMIYHYIKIKFVQVAKL